MPPAEDALVLLDEALAARPAVDTSRLTRALEALCRARDASTDARARERLSLLVTLVMGVKHPLGVPPWEALVEARAQGWGSAPDPAGGSAPGPA